MAWEDYLHFITYNLTDSTSLKRREKNPFKTLILTTSTEMIFIPILFYHPFPGLHHPLGQPNLAIGNPISPYCLNPYASSSPTQLYCSLINLVLLVP